MDLAHVRLRHGIVGITEAKVVVVSADDNPLVSEHRVRASYRGKNIANGFANRFDIRRHSNLQVSELERLRLLTLINSLLNFRHVPTGPCEKGHDGIARDMHRQDTEVAKL